METQTMEIVPAKTQEITEPARDFMPLMSIEMAVQRRQMLVEFAKSIMIDGQDFGAIPGTGSKPTLLKPGAEKLCSFFGLEPSFDQVQEVADWTGADHVGEPFYYIRYSVRLARNGRVLGVGEGSCNSWESKYRWRESKRKCPTCGAEAIIQGREEYGGGWLCWKKRGGCGGVFKEDDVRITDQKTGRVANPDIADQINTIQKMAQKRALVAAVLIATGASEFYTQDIEDGADPTGTPARMTEGIDVGGHRKGTQAAADHVAQQQIEANRQRAAVKAEPSARQIPHQVQVIWATMGSSKEKIKQALTELYADLREVVGNETARGVYDDIAKRYGAGDPVSKVGLAREVALQLWLIIEDAKRQMTEGVEGQPLLEPEAAYAE